jgi:peroxiredoxin (alkyl hydroperoxide reductase subunit C)
MSIIGQKAPNFAGTAALHDEKISVKLDDYKGKWLILFFYPLDFTFVCPTEVVAFAGAYDKFKAANTEILGCSVDSVHTHLAWIRTPQEDAGVGDLPFPLFADLDKSVAAAYDVLFGDKSLRGVFVINPEGTVVSATINFLPLGRNVEEVYRTLRAAQLNAETGDVCPANWQDGDEGMSESLDGVKKHFANH